MKSREAELGAAAAGLVLAGLGAYSVLSERFYWPTRHADLQGDSTRGWLILTGEIAVRYGLLTLLTGLGVTACALYLFFRFKPRPHGEP